MKAPPVHLQAMEAGAAIARITAINQVVLLAVPAAPVMGTLAARQSIRLKTDITKTGIRIPLIILPITTRAEQAEAQDTVTDTIPDIAQENRTEQNRTEQNRTALHLKQTLSITGMANDNPKYQVQYEMTDCASTLLARDYKGPANFVKMNGVLEFISEGSEEKV